MDTNDVAQTAPGWQSGAEEANQGLGGTVQEKAGSFAERAQAWRRQASEVTRRAATATDDYVHENPWIVIASVAAVCFAAGFFLGRSRD